MEYANSSTSEKGTRCEAIAGFRHLRCAHGVHAYVPMRCFKCNGCARFKVSTHAARIGYGLDRMHKDDSAFLTLTSNLDAEWPRLMRAFSSFMKQCRKTYPGLEYVAVKEEGSRNGMKHLHVVITGWGFVAQRTLSHWWRKRSGAGVVWISKVRVDKGHLLAYLTKYIAKGFGRLGAMKHITYSAGWAKSAKPKMAVLGSVLRAPFNHSDRVLASGTIVPAYQPDIRQPCSCFNVDVDSAEVGLVSDTGPSVRVSPNWLRGFTVAGEGNLTYGS